MSLSIQCSECKKKYNINSKYAGKRIACPNCKTPIQVSSAEAEPIIDVEPVADEPVATSGDPFSSDLPSFDDLSSSPPTTAPLAADTHSQTDALAWGDLGPGVAPASAPTRQPAAASAQPTQAEKPKSTRPLVPIIAACSVGGLALVSLIGLLVWLGLRDSDPGNTLASAPGERPVPTNDIADVSNQPASTSSQSRAPSPGPSPSPPPGATAQASEKKSSYGGPDVIALVGRPGANGVLPAVRDPLPVAEDGDQSYDMDFNSKRNGVCVVSNALLSFDDKYRRFPASRSADKAHEIYFSWRVEILPLLGHQELYDRFDKNQPWDSKQNIALLQEMPEQFRVDGDAPDSTDTRVCLFLHPRMVFDGSSNEINMNMNRIRDVLKTIVIGGVVGRDKAVPWTKPEDFEVDFNDFIGSLGDTDDYVDLFTLRGQVLRLPSALDDAIFVPLLTRDGGEAIDFAQYQRWAAAYYRVPYTSKGLMVNDEARKMSLLHRVMTYHWDKQKPVPDEVFDVTTRKMAPPTNLSWRVHLLRNLDYGDLHQRFHFNEPWDSPHNLELAKHMPEIYRDAAAAHDSTTTRFVGLVSDESLMTPDKMDFDLTTLKDRPDQTIVLIQAPPDKAVPWTKPQDFPLNLADSLDGIRPIPESGLLTVFADGGVHYLIRSTDETSFKAMATRAGREVFNPTLFFKYGNNRNGG